MKMFKDSDFPWDPPISVYDTAGPRDGQTATFEIDGVSYTVAYNGEQGIDTGRDRFIVECNTCEVLLHENTTGPRHYIEEHHREKHK